MAIWSHRNFIICVSFILQACQCLHFECFHLSILGRYCTIIILCLNQFKLFVMKWHFISRFLDIYIAIVTTFILVPAAMQTAVNKDFKFPSLEIISVSSFMELFYNVILYLFFSFSSSSLAIFPCLSEICMHGCDSTLYLSFGGIHIFTLSAAAVLLPFLKTAACFSLQHAPEVLYKKWKWI